MPIRKNSQSGIPPIMWKLPLHAHHMIQTKEPVILAKEPVILAKEPFMTKESFSWH